MEVGDQRAHDLIDEADSETDPQHAIQLLHRALEYGTTGIQAGKAYQSLGMRHEDAGDIDAAITYYTKALEVGTPNPFTMFWRGELYYQQGNIGAARHDFVQALKAGLWPPERETAQQRITEIESSSNRSS